MDDNIQPRNDILLIEVEKAEERTASGLYIKEDWKTLPPVGTVLKAGPKADQDLVGKKIIFERYTSVTIKGKLGQELRLAKESAVLAVYGEA